MKYSIAKSTPLSFEDATAKVTAELAREGFGILTTIDVRETLKKKLGVDVDRYLILGACNPPFAHQALQAEEEAGLLLPCNVIVYEKQGGTHVAAFDPMIMTAIMTNPSMKPIVDEVRTRLERVIAAV